jgi:predicted TIM-barrel enzyme
MKKVIVMICLAVSANMLSAASLDIVIEQAAREIENTLEKGVTAAVIQITADTTKLSEYLREELYGRLFRGKNITITDRKNIQHAFDELNFNLMWVDEKTALSIGRMVGAQFIIIGSCTNIGYAYRLRINAINTETSVLAAYVSANIDKDEALLYLAKPNEE